MSTSILHPALAHPHDRLADPKVFGPGKWDDIHGLAARATTYEKKRECLNFIYFVTSTLKCKTCLGHATEYVKAHPPEEFLDVKDAYGRDRGLFIWTVNFHNAVNRRLGKPEVDEETAYTIHGPENEICETCGVEKADGAYSAAYNGVTAIPNPPVYDFSVFGRNPAPLRSSPITYIPTYAKTYRMTPKNA